MPDKRIFRLHSWKGAWCCAFKYHWMSAGCRDFGNACTAGVCGRLVGLGMHIVFITLQFDIVIVSESAKYLQHVSDVGTGQFQQHFPLLRLCGHVVLGKHCSSLLTFGGSCR